VIASAASQLPVQIVLAAAVAGVVFASVLVRAFVRRPARCSRCSRRLGGSLEYLTLGGPVCSSCVRADRAP
jgi:hypothetical protein